MLPFIVDDDASNESLLVHELAHHMRVAFDRKVQHLNLTRSQWRALAILKRKPGIRQNKMAECMEIEPITLARLLDRMEKTGWVMRKPDPEDRRANQVYVTSKAQGIIKEMRTHALSMRNDILEGFSAKEHATLLDYLRRMKVSTLEILEEK